MSEFSDSYHLRADDQQQGVALLKSAGMGGYVYPATRSCELSVRSGRKKRPKSRQKETSRTDTEGNLQPVGNCIPLAPKGRKTGKRKPSVA
jgi:hypothetical protein